MEGNMVKWAKTLAYGLLLVVVLGGSTISGSTHG
jgi:hypothetical protein